MKKLNNTIKAVIFVAIITSCGTAKARDMCTPQPTCESLGFTKTEAICVGQDTLKCPFDRNKVYCYKRSDVRKYNKFDSYIINGTTVGIVIKLDSGGTSGTNGMILSSSHKNTISNYGPFRGCGNLTKGGRKYCEELKDGGFSWRYPTLAELTHANGLPNLNGITSGYALCFEGATVKSVIVDKDDTFTYNEDSSFYSWKIVCVADF